jgi:hypothetical protein
MTEAIDGAAQERSGGIARIPESKGASEWGVVQSREG